MWRGLVGYGRAWLGWARCCSVGYGRDGVIIWHGRVRWGEVWSGRVRYGQARSGRVGCGRVWVSFWQRE